jgi:gamma-glutamylcysteine synthetase
LKKCWDDIIYYRGLENGLYVLKNDIQIIKNQKKEDKAVAKSIKEEAKAFAKAEKKPAAKRAKKDKDSNNMTMLDFVEANKSNSNNNNNMQIAEPKDCEDDDSNFNKKGICLFSEDEPYYEIIDNKSVNMCTFSEDSNTNTYNFDNKSVNMCLFSD